MRNIKKGLAILVSMVLVFMNVSGNVHGEETIDFSQYITSASLKYKEADEYKAYTDETKLASTTPLLFQVEADVPVSALSTDHKINYVLPDGLNLDDTTSTEVYLKGDETKSIGSYNIANSNMVIDLSSLDYGNDQSKSILLNIETTTSHLSFTDSEAKIYFKKATLTSSSEVMVSVLQTYQDSINKSTDTNTKSKKSTKQVITTQGVSRESSVSARTASTPTGDSISGDIAGSTNYLQWGSDHNFYLSGDAKINNDVVVTKKITLDLNGYTLTVNNKKDIKIDNGATLTINDSTKNESYKEETSIVDDKKYGHEAQYDDSSKTLTYYVTESKVDTKDSRLTVDTLVKHTVALNSAVGRGVLTGDSGNGTTGNVIYIQSGGTLNLNGGTLRNSGPNVIEMASGNTKMNMNGGAIHPNSSNTRALNCVSGFSFKMTNGYIYGGVSNQGGAIYNDGGTLELSGGVIAANHTNYSNSMNDQNYWTGGKTYCGGGIYNNSGTINISGNAVISGNYTGDKNYSIDDYGNVQNVGVGDNWWKIPKEAGFGMGGGIYAYKGTVNINGGYITNNIKYGSENGQGWNDYGGGGIACYEATINMNNGYITGNKSQETSGGISLGLYDKGDTTNGNINVHHSTFAMNGGFLSSNYAETGEGGGMRIACNSTANIYGSKDTKVYVTNNKTNTNFDWGGGGIFIQGENEKPDICGKLNIKNVTVTENKAGGYGAGVAVCPTGQTIISDTDGGAIYNNSANNSTAKSSRTNISSDPEVSGGGAGKTMDSTIAKPVFKAAVTGDNASKNIFGKNGVPDDLFLSRSKWNSSGNEYTNIIALVMGSMLGGGDANWRGVYDSDIKQNGLDANGHPNKSVTVNNVNATTISRTGHIAAKYLIGLTANEVSTSDQQSATEASNVFVTGNESGIHGGGIMTNGALKIGEAKSQAITPSFNITGLKKYLIDQSNYYPTSDTNYTKFQFDVYKDSVAVGNLISKDLYNDNQGKFNFNVSKFVELTESNNNYDLSKTQYVYWVKEHTDDKDGISYDTSRYKIEITVGKISSENIELMGVSFETYGITGVKVTHYQSDGTTEIAHYDTYTKNSDGTYTITLKNKDSDTQAFTNKNITQFKIKKIDKDSKAALSGAKFSLYQHGDSENKLVKENSETNDNGEITFTDISKGNTYYLIETKAPDNYLKAKTPWVIKTNSDTQTVTIYKSSEELTDQTDLLKLNLDESKLTQLSEVTTSENTKVAEFEIGNTRAYTMPNTGGKGTQRYYQLGFLLLSVVNVLWIIKRRVV